MPFAQANTAHAAGGATHGPHVGLLEARGLALAAEQHDVAAAVGNGGAYQHIALIQFQGAQAHAALTGKIGQRGLLHGAVGSGHENVVALGVLVHRQDGRHPLALLQRQQVDHRPPARIAARQRYLVDLEPVHLAHIGKTQNSGVGAGNQQVLDKVLVFYRGGRTAHPAPALGLVIGQGLGLGIAAVGDGDHPVFLGDQVFHCQVVLGRGYLGAALVAELRDDLFQFLANDQLESIRVRQDLEIIGNFPQLLLVLVEQLLVLQAGQPVQAQVEDSLGLGRGQVVLAIAQAVSGLQVIRAAGIAAGALQHPGHLTRLPGCLQQFLPGLGGAGGCLDQGDHRVDVGQGYGQALQQVTALAGLAQEVNRAPRHHLPAVADKGLEYLLEVQRAGLAVHQGDHIDAEDRLQAGLGIQVVEHHIADLATAQLDYHPQPVLVGLIPQLGDALDFFLLDQLGDALDPARGVELVGKLVNDDDVLAALLVMDHLRPRPHIDAAATGAVGLDDARATIDDGRGGEVRPGDVLHQVIDGQIGVFHQGEAAADDFGQVVRRNIGGHAHRDPGGTVDQQVRHPGGQHVGDSLGAVVVVDEVHRLLVEVRQQRVGYLAHANLGVAHGRGGVAIYGAKVTLAIHQHVTHGKGLRHAHDGIVDRRIPVGVILTDHVPHYPGGLLVTLVPVVAELVHCMQHAPVHRLEAVAHIRQGSPDDDAHGVVQVRLLELVLDIDGKNFFGYFTHVKRIPSLPAEGFIITAARR